MVEKLGMTEKLDAARPVLLEKDRTLQFIQQIYTDATNTIRHYDTQRSALGGILGALISALTAALIAVSKEDLDRNSAAIVCSSLMFLSTFLLAAVVKLNSLIRLQRARASEAISAYEKFAGDRVIATINENAYSRIKKSPVAKLPLAWIWYCILVSAIISNGAALYIFLFTA